MMRPRQTNWRGRRLRRPDRLKPSVPDRPQSRRAGRGDRARVARRRGQDATRRPSCTGRDPDGFHRRSRRGAIKLPHGLDAWREAAGFLPLGRNEKLFLEVVGESPFAPETHVLGNPRDPRTAAYYIRPFGGPVIECFFGGEGAEMIEENGPTAGFDYALGQLVALFGSEARRSLRPLIASSWSRVHPHRRRIQLCPARPRRGAATARPPLRGSLVLRRRSHERSGLLHRPWSA